MIIYFTDNHMFGRDFEANFTFKGKEYRTLREFIEANGMTCNTLKMAVIKRLNSNSSIFNYLSSQDAVFYHISQEAMQRAKRIKGYSISKSDICENNILGQIYTNILNTQHKKKVKTQFKLKAPVNTSKCLYARVCKSYHYIIMKY